MSNPYGKVMKFNSLFPISLFQFFVALILSFLISSASPQLDIPQRDDFFDTGFGRAGYDNLDYRNVLARLEFQGVQQCTNNVASQWAYETNVNELSQLQAVSLNNNFTYLIIQTFSLKFLRKRVSLRNTQPTCNTLSRDNALSDEIVT